MVENNENNRNLISRLLESGSGIATKIIVSTASAFEEDRLKVQEHGGDDFVRKPFRDSEIFEGLHRHLGVSYVYEQEDDPGFACQPARSCGIK